MTPPLIVVCNGVEYMRIEPKPSDTEEARCIEVVPRTDLEALCADAGAVAQRDLYARQLRWLIDGALGESPMSGDDVAAMLDRLGGR
jgi:hypothetical protein